MRRITVLILTIAIFTVSLCACSQKSTKPDEVQIHSICELATLKCYYNNVAKSNKPKQNFFEKDREFWVEYKGIANIGIDASQVKIKIKDENVTITMPEAILLGTDVVEGSFSYVLSEDGLFIKNEITAEDQQEAVVKAEDKMVETVKNNSELFASAKKRAKELIENYINKVGEKIGVKYQITWDEIEDNQA